ncbi:MAG: hypothetical protein HY587_07530 [Candidatus Omnitrophica bacterium]|nr:hypothetical protein [Candidatus Omnitrophota bacterium]
MDFTQFLTAENASIAAIVMIVALFLKFMGKYSEKIDSIARECHQQSMQSQKLYQEQMKEIADNC